MNALDQYLELYRSHRSVIDANAPAALNGAREAAYEWLARAGRLPRKGDEGYEETGVDEMFAPDFGLNITRVDFPVDLRTAFSCAVPNVSLLSALIVNDAFVAMPSLEANLPEGVEVMSLARAAALYPELFANPGEPVNAVAALNDLFVQDGVFIRVKAGVRLDKPVQVLSIFNSARPMMAVRRIRIVIEDGASASVLLCDHPKAGDIEYMNCRMVDATVGHDATLHVYDLEEATAHNRRASVTVASQHTGSRFDCCDIFLNGGMTRNDLFIRHLGEHCTTRLSGLVIGGGAQIIDNAVHLPHTFPRCTSEQVFKYALFDSSHGAFEGDVTVAPGACFTDARQSNRNLLVSPDARMHSQPQLVIYCDEVKAAHGSATGQLDENALFYMRSRGIPETEARMMLINAFMDEVLDYIDHEALRERLRCLVDKRLRGSQSVCEGCNALH